MKYTKIGETKWMNEMFQELKKYVSNIDYIETEQRELSEHYIKPGIIFEYKRKNGYTMLAIATNVIGYKWTKPGPRGTLWPQAYRQIYQLNEEGVKVLQELMIQIRLTGINLPNQTHQDKLTELNLTFWE